MLQKETFLLYVNITTLCFLWMFKKESSDIKLQTKKRKNLVIYAWQLLKYNKCKHFQFSLVNAH